MALINCPDCGKKISDSAPNCPDCGRPIQPGIYKKQSATPIEATGKKWKVIQIYAGLGIVVSFLIIFLGIGFGNMAETLVPGFLVMIGSLIALIYGGLGAWWHHG